MHKDAVHAEAEEFRIGVLPPVGIVEADVLPLQGCTEYAHQSAAGYEAAGKQSAFLASGIVEGLVAAASRDKPVDGAANEQRQVEFQGDEHAEGKGEGRHAEGIQQECNESTDAVKQPGCSVAAHQRFNHCSHRVGLRSRERAVGEAIGLVEYHDDAGHGCRADECAKELPCLLFSRSAAEPVAYLQVGDEAACHAQGCADHAAHDESSHHTARAAQTYGYHDDGGHDECHQSHAADGICADDGDGVGCHGGEEESNDAHDKNGNNAEYPVAAHHIKVEEEESEHKSQDDAEGDESHRKVLLRARSLDLFDVFLAFELSSGQRNGFDNNAPALHNADDAGHRDAANADALRVFEDDFG